MITDVYDIEGEIEKAITAILNATLLSISTQDKPALQRARGRAEVQCSLGSGLMHLAPSEETALLCDVEDAWNLTTSLELISEADMAAHTTFRSAIRLTMFQLPPLINGVLILNHVIYGPMRHLGSTVVTKADGGYYVTKMNFACHVSIHTAAWQSLQNKVFGNPLTGDVIGQPNP